MNLIVRSREGAIDVVWHTVQNRGRAILHWCVCVWLRSNPSHSLKISRGQCEDEERRGEGECVLGLGDGVG